MWIVLSVSVISQAQTLQCQEVYRRPHNEAPLQVIRDLWLSFARRSGSHSDYKYLADLIMRPTTWAERRLAINQAKNYRRQIYNRLRLVGQDHATAARLSQRAYARRILENFFENKTQLKNINQSELGPRLEIRQTALDFFNFTALNRMFRGLENAWTQLIKRVNFEPGGSLLRVDDIIFMAGGRFRESYYWDSFFGSLGLVVTGRTNLVVRAMNKYIKEINEHGFIRNGGRSYYSTRSQPPVISLMARLVYDNTRHWRPENRRQIDQWLQGDVLKALEKDYNDFWMRERWDQETGLNFYSDSLNTPRPEAHSRDRTEDIARSERDCRGECESGQDFSDVFSGQASRTLSVQLNAFLFGYETNLSWLHSMKGNTEVAQLYRQKAQQRADAIQTYLRDPDGLYRNYNLESRTLNAGVSGEIFSLLFTRVLTPEQAATMVPRALQLLEKEGGIAASTLLQSKKQWDGNYGWAPYQIMAVQGLKNYGYEAEAQRLMLKWVSTNLNIFEETGQFYEKVDVTTGRLPPADNSKYPNQVGFLWTNSSVVWMLHQLGYRFQQP